MDLSFLLYYNLQQLLKDETVIIRTLFQLCITLTIIAARHYPAIFIVFRAVSLHISTSESISGYGCRVFRVVYFESHQINEFRRRFVCFPFKYTNFLRNKQGVEDGSNILCV